MKIKDILIHLEVGDKLKEIIKQLDQSPKDEAYPASDIIVQFKKDDAKAVRIAIDRLPLDYKTKVGVTYYYGNPVAIAEINKRRGGE